MPRTCCLGYNSRMHIRISISSRANTTSPPLLLRLWCSALCVATPNVSQLHWLAGTPATPASSSIATEYNLPSPPLLPPLPTPPHCYSSMSALPPHKPAPSSSTTCAAVSPLSPPLLPHPAIRPLTQAQRGRPCGASTSTELVPQQLTDAFSDSTFLLQTSM